MGVSPPPLRLRRSRCLRVCGHGLEHAPARARPVAPGRFWARAWAAKAKPVRLLARRDEASGAWAGHWAQDWNLRGEGAHRHSDEGVVHRHRAVMTFVCIESYRFVSNKRDTMVILNEIQVRKSRNRDTQFAVEGETAIRCPVQ